jgi:hypothetical protein
MTTDSHRLSILTAREIDDLYGLPRFADEDRHLYFGLSVPEREAVHTHTDSVAVEIRSFSGLSPTNYMKTTFVTLIVAINLMATHVVQAQERTLTMTKFEQQVWIVIFESKVREVERQGIRVETQTVKDTNSVFNQIRFELPKTDQKDD